MSIKSLATKVTSTVGRQLLQVKKNSPTVMFVAGTVGVVGAAVLASRATLKLSEALERAEHNLDLREMVKSHGDYESEQDYKKDGIKIRVRLALDIAKLYAPAVGVGVISIAALTGSHVVLTRRNAALSAAYATLAAGFKQYRSRVIEELGAEKDQEFRWNMVDKEIVEEDAKGVKVTTVKAVGIPKGMSMYARCFDEGNLYWKPTWDYNQFFIQCKQNWANDMLNNRGHLFLNEVYDMLGFERVPEGQVVGWVKGNGDGYVDFGIFAGNRFQEGVRFAMGNERSVWLDFNVDGVVYKLI